MAPEVHYSYKAERDLEKTIDYTVNKWGAQQADEYITGLETLAQQLAESAAMGVSNILGNVELFAFPYKSHTLYPRKISWARKRCVSN